MLATLLALLAPAPAWAQGPDDDLRRLAQDYARDPNLTAPLTFGMRIDDADWTIAADRCQPGSPRL
jgi:hypothetical protein